MQIFIRIYIDPCMGVFADEDDNEDYIDNGNNSYGSNINIIIIITIV